MNKRTFPIRHVPAVYDADDEQIIPAYYVVMHQADAPRTSEGGVLVDLCTVERMTNAQLIAAALDLFTNGPRPEPVALAMMQQEIEKVKEGGVRLHQRLVEKDAMIVQLTIERDRARRERDKLGGALVDKMTEAPTEAPTESQWSRVAEVYLLDEDAAERMDDAIDERMAEAEAADDPMVEPMYFYDLSDGDDGPLAV